MEELAKRFRRRAREAGCGGPGQRYPAELRRMASGYWSLASSAGQSLSEAARALGIREVTLGRWARESVGGEGAKPGTLCEVVLASSADGGRALVTPSGYRVEGLSLAELRELLSELR